MFKSLLDQRSRNVLSGLAGYEWVCQVEARSSVVNGFLNSKFIL